MIKIIILILLFSKTFFSYIPMGFLENIDEIFVMFLFLLALMNISKRKLINSISLKIAIGFIIFYMIGILSFLINSNDIGNIKYAILGGILQIKWFILVFSLLNLDIKTNKFIEIYKYIRKIGLIITPIFLLQFIFPGIYLKFFPFNGNFQNESFLGFNGLVGPFTHPAISGFFYTFLAAGSLAMYISNKNEKTIHSRYFFIFSVIAISSLKAKTIGVILVFFVIFILYGRSLSVLKKLFLSIIPLSVSVYFGSSIIMRQINRYLLGNIIVSGDYSARYLLLANSLELAKEYSPLGVGFSQYGTKYSGEQYSDWYYKFGMNNIFGLMPNKFSYVSDSFWSGILGETGLFGLITYVSILILIIVVLLKKYLKMNKENINSFFLIVFSILLVLTALIESTGTAVFNNSPNFMLFSLIIVGAFKIQSYDKKKI